MAFGNFHIFSYFRAAVVGACNFIYMPSGLFLKLRYITVALTFIRTVLGIIIDSVYWDWNFELFSCHCLLISISGVFWRLMKDGSNSLSIGNST
ncbi:hypothetical protein BKA65DRAFT_266649 [Rhexocercosporidium sp. MPI-PUGE-AT-0058]|nr:hypothetical protein BKA65DRAFT_266649 [Rhexocercosporidium sp. MPI-PUGE-AT-0058]